MKMQTTGYAEMSAELRLMQEAVQTTATKKAVRDGAAVILGAMKDRAPVLDQKTATSTALDPGALKADISIGHARTDKLGFFRVWIGPKINWHVAHWVEYGHYLVKGGYLSLKRGKLQGHGHRVGEVRQHPFIRPAYEASERPALLAFAESMKTQLRRWVS